MVDKGLEHTHISAMGPLIGKIALQKSTYLNLGFFVNGHVPLWKLGTTMYVYCHSMCGAIGIMC